MAKILLVEDDNNLGEIYRARLEAEGYAIVYAHDGEEALSLAPSEKPDLVISDVMMPKVSGFEMLDILRNTDGLKDLKVIMLTALGQSEDKIRADKLGADRYLVKSQVTLEDIITAVKSLLDPAEDQPISAPAPITPTQVTSQPTPAPMVASEPVAPAPTSTPMPTPAPAQPQPSVTTTPSLDQSAPVLNDNASSTTSTASTDTATDMPTSATTPQASTFDASSEPVVASNSSTPTLDTTADAEVPTSPDLASNLAYTNEAPTTSLNDSPASPTPAADTANLDSSVTQSAPQASADEAKDIESQINQFVADQSVLEAQSPSETSAATTDASSVAKPATPSANDSNDSLIATAVDQLKTSIETTEPQPVAPAPETESLGATETTPAPSPSTDAISQPPQDNLITPTQSPVVEPNEAVAPQASPEISETPRTYNREDPDDSNDDSAQVAHKKVISPIVDSNPRPDINTLLAREEASQPAAPAQPVIGGQPASDQSTTSAPQDPVHAPGNVYQPSDPDADPSSIAL